MSESKFETFSDKIERNESVIKIVEYFYIKDILDNLVNQPLNIFGLLDEELIRISDYYKNKIVFDSTITCNLLEILVKKNYIDNLPLVFEIILTNILYHIILNSDENYKVHSLFFEKLSFFRSNDIVNVILNKVEDNFKKHYPNQELKYKKD